MKAYLTLALLAGMLSGWLWAEHYILTTSAPVEVGWDLPHVGIDRQPDYKQRVAWLQAK